MRKQHWAAIFLALLAVGVGIVLTLSLRPFPFLYSPGGNSSVKHYSSTGLVDLSHLNPRTELEGKEAADKFSYFTAIATEEARVVSFNNQGNVCTLMAGRLPEVEEGYAFLEKIAAEPVTASGFSWKQVWQQQETTLVGFGGRGIDNFLFIKDGILYWLTVYTSGEEYSLGRLLSLLLTK